MKALSSFAKGHWARCSSAGWQDFCDAEQERLTKRQHPAWSDVHLRTVREDNPRGLWYVEWFCEEKKDKP